MRVRFRAQALLVSAALLSVPIFAQSDYGSITGFVKDPSGAIVPKAKVIVKNEATGIEHPVTTGESGYYVAPNLPPGLYTVSAEAAGFKKFDSAHNKLDPNSTLSLDVALTVGNATETVEVAPPWATSTSRWAAACPTRSMARVPRTRW
jgi:hypothetical protein